MPTSLGPAEILVILVVALIVLGPQRLPEVARTLGKLAAELRRAASGITDELQNASVHLEIEAKRAAQQSPPAPPAAPVAHPRDGSAPEAPPASAPPVEKQA